MITRYFNPCLEVSGLQTTVTFRDGEGLAMRFQVVRTMTPSPDTCVIEIANLDPARAKAMISTFVALGTGDVRVRGGYDGLLSGIFAGTLRSAQTGMRAGPDVWTRLIADDGGDVVAEVLLRISNAAMTATDMINVAAAAMGLDQAPSVAAVLAQSDYTAQGPYAAVMTARASDLLDAACRRIRARWWIRDRTLHLGAQGRPDRTRPAVVVPDSALVSPPSLDGAGVVHSVAFLDPRIVPGSQVVIQGQHQRVESVVFSGETRGGLWTVEILGRTL